MEYRHLGTSGLRVSSIGLGTNNFGDLIDERQAAAVIHRAVDLGINFLDTSNSYGEGLAEEYIGRAVRGIRHEVLIATKVGRAAAARQAPDLPGTGDPEGASRHAVMRAAEQSLRRLATQYIDLYLVHLWDAQVPIAETLRALDDLVRSGKVRHVGCSGFAAWQISQAVATSRALGMTTFSCAMTEYNLLQRDAEREIVPCCRAWGLGLIPFFPLAGGLLTGKYRQTQPPPDGTRLAIARQRPDETWAPRKRRFLSIVGGHLAGTMTEQNFALLERLEQFAAERSHTLTELALAWLLTNPAVSGVIPGATSPAQVTANVRAGEWHLTADDLAALDRVQEVV